MPDFKFAKGFFTGVLVTDVIATTGLLFLTWHTLYTLKPRKDYNRPLRRYDSWYEYRKHERDKEFFF